MNSLKGTITEKNILTAFMGESQARNKYTYFASVAKKEGYEQISAIFTETADNEKEHAKRLFKFLEGGDVSVSVQFPAGIISDTIANLEASANGENHEHTQMYPEFAHKAKEEGFLDIADVFTSIAKAELYHEKRFLKLLNNIKNEAVFKKEELTKWKCGNCGYVHEGSEAPDKCPACNHPQAYFEELNEKLY